MRTVSLSRAAPGLLSARARTPPAPGTERNADTHSASPAAKALHRPARKRRGRQISFRAHAAARTPRPALRVHGHAMLHRSTVMIKKYGWLVGWNPVERPLSRLPASLNRNAPPSAAWPWGRLAWHPRHIPREANPQNPKPGDPTLPGQAFRQEDCPHRARVSSPELPHTTLSPASPNTAKLETLTSSTIRS